MKRKKETNRQNKKENGKKETILEKLKKINEKELRNG